MTSDRPVDGPGHDAALPADPVDAEPTQVNARLEPTRVIPTALPAQSWAAPAGEPALQQQQASPPFLPAGAGYAAYPQQDPGQQVYPQQGPSFTPQPGVYPAPRGLAAQPDPSGYGWPPPAAPPVYWGSAPPQRLAGFPPPHQPPQRGHGWVVALVTVAAVVVVSLIAALAVPLLAQLPSRRGGPTGSPSSSAAGTPTAKPGSSQSPASSPKPSMPSDPLTVLRKNPVYGLRVPATCAYQSMPGSQAAFRKQVGRLVDCENAAWKKALRPTAVEFSKPKVKFYSSAAKSPCGKLGTTFPASYCTGDSTLYFSLQSYLQGRYFRLSVAEFVMHEYAHHVQHLAGIFDATDAMDESFALTTRRIELQAHCMAHYSLVVSKVGYTSLDRRELEYQWGFTNDPGGHGSTKAEAYWGRRGLDGKTIGACNTWTVKPGRVK